MGLVNYLSSFWSKGPSPDDAVKASGDSEILPFDVSRLKACANIVILGKRQSGKTTLAKSLVNHYRCQAGDKKCKVVLISSVEKIGGPGRWKEAADETFESSPDAFEKLYKDRHRSSYEDRCTDHLILVLEETDKPYYWRETAFKLLWDNNEALNMSIIACIQYPVGLPPQARDNIDYFFGFRDTEGTLRLTHKNFAGTFPTFESFRDAVGRLTGYACLVIDHRTDYEATKGGVDARVGILDAASLSASSSTGKLIVGCGGECSSCKRPF